MTTMPFLLHAPPYTDEDVPLPRPYNAAFPHPLSAYASSGVNPTGPVRAEWRQKLDEMLDLDPSLVKGAILAASNTLPPALSVPVFLGEGCAIPERLWSTIERGTEASPLVTTPGGRRPSNTFTHIRTNFSNVLRSKAKPQSFKTEMCKEWQRMGRCLYEQDCLHAHGYMELRTIDQSSAAIPIPPRRRATYSNPGLELDLERETAYTHSAASLSPVTPTFGSCHAPTIHIASSVSSLSSSHSSAHDSWDTFADFGVYPTPKPLQIDLADCPYTSAKNIAAQATKPTRQSAASQLASAATRSIWA